MSSQNDTTGNTSGNDGGFTLIGYDVWSREQSMPQGHVIDVDNEDLIIIKRHNIGISNSAH